MPLHTQFMLANATRQNDNYVEYTGCPWYPPMMQG